MLATIAFGLLLQPEFLPLKEGHVWTYERRTTVKEKTDQGEHVVRVTGREKIGSYECVQVEGWGGSQKASLVLDETGLRIVRMDGADKAKPPHFLRFPLEKGKRWTAEYTQGKSTRKLSFHVIGKESVTVAAGRYQAWKLEFSREGLEAKVELWLAENIGEVRSRYTAGGTETVFELKSFEKKRRRFRCASCRTVSEVQKECCGALPAEADDVRAAKICRCRLLYGKGKCKCRHCAGEEGAQCYCEDSGCKCGITKSACRCGHCMGRDAGDDGRGGCTCGKK